MPDVLVSQSASFSLCASLYAMLAWWRVVRIREIADPDLRVRIVAALAQRRGCSIAAIPEWFELDDADYVDLLNDLRSAEAGDDEETQHDPRM
jgi:hypothetical protein